jgi:hypothetical protein
MGRTGAAARAKSAHNVKFAGKKTYRTAKGVHRSLTGGFGTVALPAAAIAGGIVAARRTGADKVVLGKVKQVVNNRATQNSAKDWLRNNGYNV